MIRPSVKLADNVEHFDDWVIRWRREHAANEWRRLKWRRTRRLVRRAIPHVAASLLLAAVWILLYGAILARWR